MKRIDLNYFPGWVRKSMTFTIDDGNLRLDKIFLDITKPAGFKGTFNLCTPLRCDRYNTTPEGFRKFYEGYEIANHCYRHVYPLTKETDRPFKDEPFDKETADPAFTYPSDEDDIRYTRTYAWCCYTPTAEGYMRCVRKCQQELEDLFGKGKIRGYVWPCGEQKNDEVFDLITKEGFQSSRFAYPCKDEHGYNLPPDRMRWTYNADCNCMPETAAQYEALPDDGKLKFYCFGVHSHDFENAGKWDVLIDFCKKYGNRPEDFWYASVGEIFDYEDAVKAVEITDTAIRNPSPVNLAIKIDGVRTTLWANSEIKL